MNAAARSLHQNRLFYGNVMDIEFNTHNLLVVVLMSLLLISALSVVYFKDEQRSLISQLQSEHHQSQRLETEWGQLLLEQSTLVTAARIQRVAQSRLGMEQATPANVVVLHR